MELSARLAPASHKWHLICASPMHPGPSREQLPETLQIMAIGSLIIQESVMRMNHRYLRAPVESFET